MHGNTVDTPGASLEACGVFLSDWVQQGHDEGTRSAHWPRDEDLVEQGRKTLYTDPVRVQFSVESEHHLRAYSSWTPQHRSGSPFSQF